MKGAIRNQVRWGFHAGHAHICGIVRSPWHGWSAHPQPHLTLRSIFFASAEDRGQPCPCSTRAILNLAPLQAPIDAVSAAFLHARVISRHRGCFDIPLPDHTPKIHFWPEESPQTPSAAHVLDHPDMPALHLPDHLHARWEGDSDDAATLTTSGAATSS